MKGLKKRLMRRSFGGAKLGGYCVPAAALAAPAGV
jgi:hypothetical protein